MSKLLDFLGLGGAAQPSGTLLSGATNIGCRRKQNQDAWAWARSSDDEVPTSAAVVVQQGEDVRETGRLSFPAWAAVADGMGGAKGGDVASRRALAIVGERLNAAETTDDESAVATLSAALRKAHQILEAEANANDDLTGMGCTYSTLWWAGDGAHRAVLGQVGDSRIYRWRQGELTQLTRDQTLVQRMLDEGSITPENAVKAKFSSVLEFALGANGGPLEPEVRWVDFEVGDLLLICSDGLHGVLSDADLARILPKKAVNDLMPYCDRLIKDTRAGGAPDNVTVILVQIV